MKHGFLIFNPSAGQKLKSSSELESVLRRFSHRSIDITPSPTEPDGNVIHLVRDLLKEKPDLLVTWGGDGTIHEVANGMFGNGVPLGILPGGTANLCARELRIPTDVAGAVDIIAAGKTRKISVGQANHRYFLLMAGIGFDADVVKNVDWHSKRRFGKLAFAVSAWNTARKYGYPKFRLRVDGEEKECVFAVISNAREYAAFFTLTPDADISDEYLHVCLFKRPGILNSAQYALHALMRSHTRLDSVELLRAGKVEALGDESIAVQADGELVGYLPMKFQIHPSALQVFCP